MQRDEGGGRILLGDNTGGGAVMLQCDGAWISAVLPYTYIRTQLTVGLLNTDLSKMRHSPYLPKRN